VDSAPELVLDSTLGLVDYAPGLVLDSMLGLVDSAPGLVVDSTLGLEPNVPGSITATPPQSHWGQCPFLDSLTRVNNQSL